jgi:hypothetical protein
MDENSSTVNNGKAIDNIIDSNALRRNETVTINNNKSSRARLDYGKVNMKLMLIAINY